jgi:phage repressor protein C with HTH and peptisase S24 domain
MSEQPASAPEWSLRIKRLILHLKTTQASFAESLSVSPTMISRWVKGTHEPNAQAYIALGNLAGLPDGIYFWERAGMDPANLQETKLKIAHSSLPINLGDFAVLTSKRLSKQVVTENSAAVLIPLLNLIAFADVPQEPQVSVSQAEVVDVFLAPLSWCPKPDSLIGMRVVGDSMLPLIIPSAILAVDTSSTKRDELDGKLAVFSHRNHGYKVARFQRLSSTDIAVSANHVYTPLDVSVASKWKIVGEVLWWVSKDLPPKS